MGNSPRRCGDRGWGPVGTPPSLLDPCFLRGYVMSEICGFCRGRGQVPGPKHDAYGPRPDYPDLVSCDYCAGTGRVADGERLLPARLAAHREIYGPKTQQAWG